MIPYSIMGHSAGGHIAVEYLKVSVILDHDSLFILGHSAGRHVALKYF